MTRARLLLVAAALLVVLVGLIARAGPYADLGRQAAATRSPLPAPESDLPTLGRVGQALDESIEALATIPALQALTLGILGCLALLF